MNARHILPPDPEGMNNERAAWAASSIEQFRFMTGADKEDAVCDLLCDMMHFCDRQQMDFDHELTRARQHYEAETGDIIGQRDRLKSQNAQLRDMVTALLWSLDMGKVGKVLRAAGYNTDLYTQTRETAKRLMEGIE